MSLDELRRSIGNTRDARQLVPTLQHAVENIITPAVAPLDSEAERRVRRCVRDTMLGVTVSPWRSADLFVVLYRNGQMVMEVSAIYNGRPRLREQVSILADVLKVAATVQFLNIGSKLIENLTSWIPVLGRFTDDIAQGIGAGLFTSVTGYATIDRCRAFRGWSESEARSGMGAKLKQFMSDLKGIVADTVMPALRSRIEAETPQDLREPNLMDRIKSGIGDAIDRTCETIDFCVRKPVTVGYKSAGTTGAVLWGGIRQAGVGGVRAATWSRKHVWKVAKLAGKGTKLAAKGIARTGKSALETARKVGRSEETGGPDHDQDQE